MSASHIPEGAKCRLWGKAAGRCQYEGCNHQLYLDLKQAYTERFFCASARKMLEIPLFLWLIEG